MLSLIGALICCNDPAGVLIADRGWAMDDRPIGLFERVRLPDATLRIFRAPVPGRTGMFDEIDGIVGWYAGAAWQMAGIGKLTVPRYDNQADPAATSTRDMAWGTKFWSFGARTQIRPGGADRPAAQRLYLGPGARESQCHQIPVRLPAGQL